MRRQRALSHPLLVPSLTPPASLAAFIEVLPHRDLFFVDSDVAFRYDPYPHMEPFMATHDLVAQENDSWDHLNTGASCSPSRARSIRFTC